MVATAVTASGMPELELRGIVITAIPRRYPLPTGDPSPARAWLPPVPKPMSAKSCSAQAAAAPIFRAKISSTSTASRVEARRRASSRQEEATGFILPA